MLESIMPENETSSNSIIFKWIINAIDNTVHSKYTWVFDK